MGGNGKIFYGIIFVAVNFCSGCKKSPDTLFSQLTSDETGISFNNEVKETDSLNILTEEFFYNGGGVAIADFNNDGLKDIFFSGNLVPNALYLNEGSFKFMDISRQSGVQIPGRWNSGIAVVDINNDGWMDIYVCATIGKDTVSRTNMLFINQGLDSHGIPTFKDQAAAYGINDKGYSHNALFFDYDLDGDLDLYVLTNQLKGSSPTEYRIKKLDGSSPNTDRLYRNNGDGTFTNVSKQAGITIEGFGLGIATADFNKDGWPDLYISNDYISNDILYINKGDGTFENKIADYIGHQSWFSMGNDVADINNDGMLDIVTLDMLPESNLRKKTTIGSKSYLTYIFNEKYNYQYQFVRNMLQLNNDMQKGIKFSEIGQFAGIYETEWSWAPLMADFDNDGNKDLLITNGYPKDVTDKDFSNYRMKSPPNTPLRQLLDSIPVVKIPNYAYKNNGDLTFSDVTQKWGLGEPSFSNGAAYADLDNDGDLDYVVNNINSEAFVFKNNLYQTEMKEQDRKANFLRIKLVGTTGNSMGLGAKVTLFYNSGKKQYQECSLSRGYLSSVEDGMHFGLDKVSLVDSVFVEWPNGSAQLLKSVKANQVITLKSGEQKNDSLKNAIHNLHHPVLLFQTSNSKSGILYKHHEADKIDFNTQRTIPHKFSQAGPGIAVGDVNGDGLEDFVLGGSESNMPVVFMQNRNGAFKEEHRFEKVKSKPEEDEGLLLFDADNDGDLDLYIVSGSVENLEMPAIYQDRLYINNGKGDFKLDIKALPNTQASGSCVRAADFDNDGDLDLFVGGRVLLESYPYAAQSYLLQNDKGKFSNVTKQVSPDLNKPGMITDALWTDFDKDGKVDLIVVGEFMPISFFKNNGKQLVKLGNTGLDQYTGWWNSLVGGDFDKDGDTDYVVGNLGKNNNFHVSEIHPLTAYAKDFDDNGSIDPVMACYMKRSPWDSTKELFPMHFWDELNSQSPRFRKKFSYFKKYGLATIKKLLTPEELKGAMILEARKMESCYLENMGNGKFNLKHLPAIAQLAPLNGMLAQDINGDDLLDIIGVGNDYGNEVFAGRYDASTGLVLLGNGRGSFQSVPSSASGFYVPGDAKALARITSGHYDYYVATRNRDSLKVFTSFNTDNQQVIKPGLLDIGMDIKYSNGNTERVEFYYGSGYMTQSSRNARLSKNANRVTIYDNKGHSRVVEKKKTSNKMD